MNWAELVAPSSTARHTVGDDEGHLHATGGQELGHAWSLVLAVLVIDQDLAAETDLSGQHVPAAGDQILAGAEKAGVGRAAGRHHDNVG